MVYEEPKETFEGDCPDCVESRRLGYRYCTGCGRPLGVPGGSRRSLSSVISLIVPIVAVLLLAEAAAMVLGIGDVWNYASSASMNILVLKPELSVAGTIEGAALQAFWAFLVLTILASLAVLAWQTLPALKGSPGRMTDRLQETPMFWMCLLLCASLLLNVVISLPQIGSEAVDPTTMLRGPEALLAYADAAVWEEVISRMAIIGVPLTMLALCQFRKDSLRYLLGGFGMSRLGLVLLVVSALAFGFAHAPGWGSWKILPTFITGLALGYLYMRFGIHVSIVFHFAVDYMAVLVDGPVVLVVSVIMILIVLTGILCIVEIARRIGNPLPAIRAMPAIIPPDQESIFRRRP